MQKSNWTWHDATGTDVPEIKDLAVAWFQSEIHDIFTPDPIAYMRNVTQALVLQYYNPLSELIKVAKDSSGRIVAYVWAGRGERALWSDQEMIVIKMVHVDLSLGPRQRIALIREMIMLWELWARDCGVPVICSTTMRGDQTAFLRIHTQMGYDVRGSYAYKRLEADMAGSANSHDALEGKQQNLQVSPTPQAA